MLLSRLFGKAEQPDFDYAAPAMAGHKRGCGCIDCIRIRLRRGRDWKELDTLRVENAFLKDQVLRLQGSNYGLELTIEYKSRLIDELELRLEELQNAAPKA